MYSIELNIVLKKLIFLFKIGLYRKLKLKIKVYE